MGSADLTLYAQWLADTVPTYRVSYDANGASGDAPMDATAYEEGKVATVLGNSGASPLNFAGKSFTGWNTMADGSGLSYAPGSALPIGSDNVTLYAQWSSDPTYSVVYDGNGSGSGSPPSDTISYLQGQSVTVLGSGSLVKTGCSFTGWNTMADGSGTGYVEGAAFAMGTTSVTLYAQWTAARTYTVSYNANGGTGAAPVDNTNYIEGAQAAILGPGSLSKVGYGFGGWNTVADGSGTTYGAGAAYVVGAASVTLYAQWSTNPSYTITFNANGGSGTMNAQSIVSGTSAALNANTFARSGYTFAGWSETPTGTVAYANGAIYPMGSANVILYAQWTANPSYTVTFNANGGSGTMAAQSIVSGTSAALTTNAFTRTGYNFSSWNTLANGTGTSYSNGASFTMGAANATLYAQWSTNPSYTITFNANGGSGTMNAQSIVSGMSAALNSNTFTRSGYTFAGWATSSTGAVAYANGATYTMGSANVTLYAKWTAITYSVTYNSNGATGGSVPTDGGAYQTGATVTVKANTGSLAKTNNTFIGWNTTTSGSGTKYVAGTGTFAMGSANVTLYAMWLPTPMSRYSFAGNASDAMGANAGTAYGSPTYTTDRFGVAGQALSLNGSSQYVQLANEANFDLTTFTLYAVVSVPDFTNNAIIVSKPSASGFGNFTMRISNSTQKPSYAHDTSTGNWSSVINSAVVPVNTFVHLAATLTAGTGFVGYYNGSQSYSATATAPVLNNLQACIGALPGSAYFKGVIDEVLIFNRALTAAEVTQLYNAMSKQ